MPRAQVLHSQHYNAVLQRTVVEVDRIDARGLLERAAAEAVHQHLVEQRGFAGLEGVKERRRALVELFRAAGLGTLDLGEVTAKGGEALVAGSHFARAWQSRFGRSEAGVCVVVAGFLRGALAAVFGRAYEVEETACVAHGVPVCRFRVRPVDGAGELADEIVFPVPEGEEAPPAGGELDEDALATALFGARPAADEAGHIRALGHELTHLWADFYNRVSFRFEREVPEVMGSKFANLPSIVLTEAGHVYAYHTFGGIVCSDEWDAGVRPLLREREDWVHAMVALVNALGWGTWRVERLVPRERLSLRIYDSYEGTGYRRLFGTASAPKCYLSRGAAAAIMNLLYVGDITTRPALSSSHYNQLFRSPVSFRALETRCRAMDDPYCELVVNPLSPTFSKRMRELLGNRE